MHKKLSPFLQQRSLSLFILGISAGMPLILLLSTLSLWLLEAGIDRRTITAFAWIALAYSFKFIWSPLLDSLHLPFLKHYLGRRKSWLAFSQIMMIVAIILMAYTDPAQSLTRFAYFAILLSLASATQDIAIDAYRIEIAEGDEKILSVLSAMYVCGYRVGMLIAGAGALYIASFLGTKLGDYQVQAWQITYIIMALILFLIFLLSLLAPEEKNTITSSQKEQKKLLILFIISFIIFATSFYLLEKILLKTNSLILNFTLESLRFLLSLSIAVIFAYFLIKTNWIKKESVITTWIAPFQDLWQRYQTTALQLLLLISFYRISDIVLGAIAQLFYAEIGFSKIEIANAVKIFGLLSLLLGGFLGASLAQNCKIIKLMIIAAILASLSNLLYIWLYYEGHNIYLFYFVIGVENIIAGLNNTLFVAFLSSLTNIRFSASQYALFSSIMTLFPKLLAGYSGAIVNQLNYPLFFLLSALIGIPVLFLLFMLGKKL